jgi:hypothetical protein
MYWIFLREKEFKIIVFIYPIRREFIIEYHLYKKAPDIVG